MADLKGDPRVPEAVAVQATDEELAERLGRGSTAAFEELVERHQRRIRTLCWRMTGLLQEVDDLAQETFLRVFRHRDAYQAGKPFHTWLKRICVNVCLTHRERERRHGPVLELTDVERRATRGGPGTAPPADPEATVSDAQAAHSVRRVLEALAEPFRTTLILRVFGGLSYQEIADELGCSPGTVMSRINRARIQVKTHLKDLAC